MTLPSLKDVYGFLPANVMHCCIKAYVPHHSILSTEYQSIFVHHNNCRITIQCHQHIACSQQIGYTTNVQAVARISVNIHGQTTFQTSTTGLLFEEFSEVHAAPIRACPVHVYGQGSSFPKRRPLFRRTGMPHQSASHPNGKEPPSLHPDRTWTFAPLGTWDAWGRSVCGGQAPVTVPMCLRCAPIPNLCQFCYKIISSAMHSQCCGECWSPMIV